MTTIGIVREWKTDSERRVPLTPTDVAALIKEGLAFLVEPSAVRIFPDHEWVAAGASLSEDLRSCDVLIGIKEMDKERLLPGKPHLFFSHTHKGQAANMGLLARFLEIEATLLDYELVVDERGKRTIFFGFQAGQAGMINTLWSCGQRLRALGEETPLAQLRQARHYPDLKAAKAQLDELAEELRRHPLPPPFGPLICGVTGRGNVAKGALDVLNHLRPEFLSGEELRGGVSPKAPVACVHFEERDLFERRDAPGSFDKAEFRGSPDLYRSRFSESLGRLACLVTGHYWESRFPRLVTKADVARLLGEEDCPLLVIGDVSCDVGGSIECTLRSTMPENPVYVYDPRSEGTRDGFEGPGLVIMAVDILPTEIPKDSSSAFGAALRPHLAQVARCDFSKALPDLDLPECFRRAVIAHQGQLCGDHRWLKEHLPASQGPSLR